MSGSSFRRKLLPAARGRLLLAGLACVLLAVAAGAGCGRKTAPRPMFEVLPTPGGLRAWQREGRALVAWPVPAGNTAAAHGGVEGFELLIERLPRDCPSCPPEQAREVELPLASPELRVEGRRAHYGFDLPAGPALWRFRVAVRFDAGTTRPSPMVTLETPATVPAHGLSWGRVPGRGKMPQAVRLYWRLRRERVVRVITGQGAMVEEERFYRANLYRRKPGQPWPLRPINVQPLETGQQILPRPRDGPAEFTLRLVDQFGNEGPAAPPVLIPPAQATP